MGAFDFNWAYKIICAACFEPIQIDGPNAQAISPIRDKWDAVRHTCCPRDVREGWEVEPFRLGDTPAD